MKLGLECTPIILLLKDRGGRLHRASLVYTVDFRPELHSKTLTHCLKVSK